LPPATPVTGTKKKWNDDPSRNEAMNKVFSVGQATVSSRAMPRPALPSSIGSRGPTRSASRPMAMANSIGHNAYSAISIPTCICVAPDSSAYSATTTRLPPKAM